MRILDRCGWKTTAKLMVVVLCVCVLVQMLGVPMTLLSLFTASDILTESACEDPSLLPSVPELRPSGGLYLLIDGNRTLDLPVFATSVFHPPLT